MFFLWANASQKKELNQYIGKRHLIATKGGIFSK